MKQPHDEIKAVASATECTGAVPAIPWDGDTAPQRRLVRVVGEKKYRRKK